jgi:hypothetical protein
MNSLFKLFSFILSETDSISEDFYSIKINRKYKKNYMVELAEVYDFCCSAAIQFNFTVYVSADGLGSQLVTNFELREEGSIVLLALTQDNKREAIEEDLAGIKSIPSVNQRAKALDVVLATYAERIWIGVHIDKIDISRTLSTQHQAIDYSYHLWVRSENFMEKYKIGPKEISKTSVSEWLPRSPFIGYH